MNNLSIFSPIKAYKNRQYVRNNRWKNGDNHSSYDNNYYSNSQNDFNSINYDNNNYDQYHSDAATANRIASGSGDRFSDCY